MASGDPVPSPGLTDIHNHLLPGVDDGAMDPDEAAAALARFRAVGVTALVVTPHFEAGLQTRPDEFASRIDAIDQAWARFQPLLAGTGLTVLRGVELRLDLARPDLGDARLRLGGGRFALCEFPWFTVPPRSDRVIEGLRSDGIVPIIAHPERYAGMDDAPDVVERWLDAGAFLQVNGCALLGRYGRTARRTAIAMLEAGLASYVASDYHARGDPGIAAYAEALTRLLGGEAADLLLRVNPERLLRGQEPLPLQAAAPADGGARSERRDGAGGRSAAERS